MKTPKTRLRHRTLTGLTLTALCALTVHAADWTGATSTDWNTGTNWVGDVVPNGTAAYINNGTNIATISADVATPTEIFINSGSLNHTAGSVSVQNGTNWPYGWVVIGGGNASATYNIANTAAGGGTLTGFGTGSGSLTTGGEIRVGAGAWWSGATGVLNINTSGTVNTAGNLTIARSDGDTGTVNVDAGTVTIVGGWQNSSEIATSSSTGTVTGSLNISGGTVALNHRLTMAMGIAGSNGSNVATVTMTGGTLTTDSAHDDGWRGGLYMATGYDGATGGSATVNLNGGSLSGVEVSMASADGAASTGGSATINLNGGTLSTRNVYSASWNGGTKGTSTFNFNGGTLQALDNHDVAWNQFMGGDNAITHAYVKAGGAVIDTNGFNAWVGQNLEGDIVSTGGGLTKRGLGTLTLAGTNTFTGDVVIEAGTLSINSAFIADTASVYLLAGTIFDLNYLGSDTIVGLFINGAAQNVGTWGSIGSGANFESAFFTGTGLLNVTSAIPEPSTYGILAGGLVLLGAMVRRRRVKV